MLTFESHAEINSVYWITSLEPEKQGVTRRVHEDLNPFLADASVPFNCFEPPNADQLKQLLRQIELDARAGSRPIIHFDTHGSERGIEIQPSGELISWDEIVDWLRKINVATRNNLCVVSAACFSAHAIEHIEVTKACPFHLLIAPENSITFGFTEDKLVPFYRAVFEQSDIASAYEQFLSPSLSLFHCEAMLGVALARYFRDQCIGKGAKKRREALLTQAIDSGVPNNRVNRRRIRSTSKKMIRPNREVVDRFTSIFLLGKRVFEFADLKKVIENANEEEKMALQAQRRLSKAKKN